MEERLERLQEENGKLRQVSPVKATHNTKVLLSKFCIGRSTAETNSTSLLQGADAENQLRETQWRLQQLQTQYDYLVSKSSVQNESSRHAESQIEVRIRICSCECVKSGFNASLCCALGGATQNQRAAPRIGGIAT